MSTEIDASRLVLMPVATNRTNGSASFVSAPRTFVGGSGFSATRKARSMLRAARSRSTLVGVEDYLPSGNVWAGH
jgi:hypothetical protein